MTATAKTLRPMSRVSTSVCTRVLVTALCAVALTASQAQTIATGARHGLALQADGSVLAWGDNRQAQLGQGRTIFEGTPRLIALPAKSTAVRTSRTTALVLDEQGNVWSWGTNARGQLGDGSRTDRPTPQVIFRGAVAIVNGGDIAPSFLIDSDGQPWWWGPLPSGADAAVPERAAQVPARLKRILHQARTTVALDVQGVVWSWGEGVACAATTEATGPVAMRDVPPVVDFSVTASAPSRNPQPYLPVEQAASRVTAKTADGSLWTWGTDPVSRSQLGLLSPQQQTYCPPQRMADTTFNPFEAYRNLLHPDLISAGVQFKKVLVEGDGFLGWTAEGDLWRWRYVSPYETPGWQIALQKVASDVVDASSSRTELLGLASVVMYITRDGKLHALGSNSSLHLATSPGEMDSASSPRKVALPAAAVSVHASGTGSHALLQDGRVFAWGNGATQYDPSANYVAGVAPQIPTHIPLGAPISKLATAWGQWLALDVNGKVWSSGGWGVQQVTNLRPTLVSDALGLPLAKDISVGSNGQGAILGVDGSVWTMGTNSGIDRAPMGSDLNTLFGWILVPRKVLGLPNSIVQVASALGTYGATYALDASGTVWFWGWRYQYGLAGLDGSLLPVQDWNQDVPMVLPLSQKAVSIHAADANVCAMLEDGSAQCYGKQFNEHRGRLLRLHAPIKEVSMGMDEERSGSTIYAERGGSAHMRLADGTVWAVGQGLHGQLGTGTYANVAEPIPLIDETGIGDLDLSPGTPNVPTANRPPFRVKMDLVGNLRSVAFKGDVFGSAGTPVGSNVYAMATRNVPGQEAWVQLDAQGRWGPLRWPVPAVVNNAQLGNDAQSVLLNILPQLDGTGLEGLRLYIGYGRDVDEMLARKRFREVLEWAPELKLELSTVSSY